MATSTIETDLVIDGNIRLSEGSVEVKGSVVGDVTAASVFIHLGGKIDGTLSAKRVEIEGKHKGNLKCDEIVLASTSEVTADVEARTLSTESGAKILGTIKIDGAS